MMAYHDGDFDRIADQLRRTGDVECAIESPDLREGIGPPRLILHCNLPDGHPGDHEFVCRWPQTKEHT